jgi:translocation and assembly module TamA
MRSGYACRMRPWIGTLLLLFAACAEAETITAVEVRGLDEAMTANVRRQLAIVDSIGRELSPRRLDYLLEEAEGETRRALEPFGYFSPEIRVERGAGDAGPVVVTVIPGEPVKVRSATIAIQGPGADDPALKRAVEAFAPAEGAVFDQVQYELNKALVTRQLADRGYFDADFASRRVEVTRTLQAADIDLRWDSGPRFALGAIRYEQVPKPVLRQSLLAQIATWDADTPYDQVRLDRLRESLQRLDYFSGIDIEPQRAEAVGNVVPIKVTLTPAKRSIYTAGLSYGTISGAGVRFGVERRYLNSLGHKALGEVDYAEKRKTLTLQYRIPGFDWVEGWYTISAQAADEQTDYIDNRRVHLVGSRSGEVSAKWRAVAALNFLRERWAYVAEDDGDPLTPPDYRFATMFYPELSGEYVNVDERLAPRRGWGGTALLRGGLEGAGSDATFVQAHVNVRWFKGLGPDSRLLVRGELGHTFTNALVDMPPTLRFHAGGDRSIRGYAWREVGPRVGLQGDEFPIGAKNVVTASVEYERYFNATWGAAVFLDTGSAFNRTPDIRTGVGVGLRWRSPVGPLRVDLARGLDDPDTPFQIYLNIGAEL